MSTPPEAHHAEFERTDALPRLDLNVLADATPINSDLLMRTDSWTFEASQKLRWPREVNLEAFETRAPVPKIDISKLRVVEDDFTDMLTPLELGLNTSASVAATSQPLDFDLAADHEQQAIEAIAATLEQEIVLFSAEHAAGPPLGSIETPPAKTTALHDLADLAILLDTDTPSSTSLPASNDIGFDEGITWVDIPQHPDPDDSLLEEVMPSTLAEGAEHLQRLLNQGEVASSTRARHLALHLMDGANHADAPSLDRNGLVQALFPTSHHEPAELLGIRQSLEEMRNSNALLQQAVAASQQRVEFLKAEVQRHTEIAAARDSQLATSIEELTSRRLAMRELERVIQSRDELLAALRTELEAVRVELQTAKDERGIMAINLAKTRERAKLLREQLMEKNTLLQSLHGDAAERTQTLARTSEQAAAGDLPERMLVPIDHGGPSILLDRPMLIIGRTPRQTDVCIHSSLISRQHARLIVTSEAVVVEDLKSTNGCFVNDRRIQKKMLREGDIVTLADMKYRLSLRHPRGMLTD